MNKEAMRRALAGSIFLDMVAPGWRANVNAETLDMYSPYRCVLGQVFAEAAVRDNGTDASGYHWAAFEGPLASQPYETDLALGFLPGYSPSGRMAKYVTGPDLTAAWHVLLAA